MPWKIENCWTRQNRGSTKSSEWLGKDSYDRVTEPGMKEWNSGRQWEWYWTQWYWRRSNGTCEKRWKWDGLRQGDAYWKERFVIFKDKQVGGQARLTTDEEPVLWQCWMSFSISIKSNCTDDTFQPANERVHNAKRCVFTYFIYLSLSFIYPYDWVIHLHCLQFNLQFFQSLVIVCIRR